MHFALRGALLLAFTASLWPQSAPAPAAGTPAGLETQWDIGVVLQEIGAHAGRLLPALEKLDVKTWLAKGASSTYVDQWESSRAQAKALADGTKALARNPERLSAELEILFRIQGLEEMLASLESGTRTYQTPAAAQELATLAAENGANRERLRRYIINLVQEREREFEVMDREAQRCRGMILNQSSGKKK